MPFTTRDKGVAAFEFLLFLGLLTLFLVGAGSDEGQGEGWWKLSRRMEEKWQHIQSKRERYRGR